ncbi:FHA domain-containing protein [Yimella sp. cx-573]|nr:FHA domain-containing protein [Yimella sp. cx-573]
MRTPHRMSITFTVVPDTIGGSYDISVSAPTDTPWKHVRAQLHRHGYQVPDALYVGRHRVTEADRFDRFQNGCVLAPQMSRDEQHELLLLECRHGPHVGLSTPITARAATLGRGVESTLQVDDPDMSRRHCQVRLASGRVVVSDLGSTNGTQIADQPVPGDAEMELRSTHGLKVGNSLFALTRLSCARPPARAGWIEVTRPPTRLRPPALLRLDRPRKPGRSSHRSLPWLITLLPLILGVALAWWMQAMMFLAFAVFSPVMMAAQHLSDRRDGKRSKKESAADHAAAVRRHEQRVRDALRTERLVRERAAPPLIDALHVIATAGPNLWHRHPAEHGFAQWRVGTGSINSRVVVSGSDEHERPAVLDHAPVVLDLGEDRVIGVVGPSDVALPALESLLIQLAAWHSPQRLRVAVIGELPVDWAPHLAWMPHLRTAGGLDHFHAADAEGIAEFVRRLPHDDDREQPVTTILVIADPAVLRQAGSLSSVLEHPGHYGAAIVGLAPDARSLPDRCHPIVHFSSAVHAELVGDTTTCLVPDLPASGVMARAMRGLAALRDGSTDSAAALPHAVDLATAWREATGAELLDISSVRHRWQEHKRGSARAVLGHNGSHSVEVDLLTDGPHLLVAGTTGAGKSELLQTLVGSLAAGAPPYSLNFILIDYKGGSAFRECAQLPHTVGMVTDLDGHLTARALSSLGAEIHRRERLMAQAGASDLDDFHRDPDAPTIPRLVLVIDEFRVLSEELPDFIDGLVRLATVGRSLGVHLVLATQRPAGVVSADIRANVNLRIALRVRDEGDSHDVIEAADAARLSASTPGRAYMCSGGTELQLFQTARVSVPPEEPEAIVIDGQSSRAPESAGPTILESLVAVLHEATDQRRVTVPGAPWLPPLPTHVSSLPKTERTISVSGATTSGYRFGLADRPVSQDQPVIVWAPEHDQHLAFIGGSRSGRSHALRQILEAALSDGDRFVHAYLIDFDAGLNGLRDWPAVGSYVDADEPRRIEQLLDWLTDEIKRRRRMPAQEQPRIVVAIDGWDALAELTDQSHFRILDLMNALLREATSVDIHVLATGGRGLMTSRSLPLFASQIVLAMADRDDIATLGVPRAAIPEHMPAGRGLILPDGLEVQVADVTGHAPSPPAVLPRRIDAIPDVIAAGSLTRRGDCVVLGTGTEGTVHLADTTSASLVGLICGRPRSGRTNTLRLLAEQLHDRPVCWVSPDRRTSLPHKVVQPGNGDELAQWLAAEPSGAVLIDDVPSILGSDVEDLLAMHAGNAASTGALVLATATPSELTGNYSGLIGELRRRGTGVLLMPGQHDGEALGVRCPTLDRPRPGNGFLVRDGELIELQVALVE